MNIEKAISSIASTLQWAILTYTDKSGASQTKYWLDGAIDDKTVSTLEPFAGSSLSLNGKPYILRIRKAGTEYRDSKGYMQTRNSHSIELQPNTRQYADVASMLG